MLEIIYKKISSSKEKEGALKCCDIVFEPFVEGWDLREYLQVNAEFTMSYVAVLDSEVIGTYLLSSKDIMSYQEVFPDQDLRKYKNLKGIEGVAFAVLPEFRSKGVGKQLRSIVENLGQDYIWGEQMENLNNIEHWKNHGRRVLGKVNGVYISIQDLSNKAKNYNTTQLKEHHRYQSKGYNCGPTAVQIVASIFSKKKVNDDILEEVMECNDTTGTIEIGMKKGLDYLGITNTRNPFLGDEKESIKMLVDSLKEGKIFIMRTLTQGIKHWIVIKSVSLHNNSYLFQVLDPWLGIRTSNLKEILKIWEPRNYDGIICEK